jgi:hypothetical protein
MRSMAVLDPPFGPPPVQFHRRARPDGRAGDPECAGRKHCDGDRITLRHPVELIGSVRLVKLTVRDVGFALGQLAQRLSTRSVRLARMTLIPGAGSCRAGRSQGRALWPYLAVSMFGGIGPEKARAPRRPEVDPKPAPPTEAGAGH